MMSAMSVFNSSVPEPNKPVLNVLDWSGLPTGRDVEKAANRVVGAVEKTTERMSGKLSTDVQRGTDRIASAVKDNTEKITDALKRIATTNASGGSPNVPMAVGAIHRGLLDISESADCIAENLIAHPDEMGAATEAAEAVGRRFSELVNATSKCNEGNERLRLEVEEMEKTMDWVDYKFSIPDGGDQCTPVFNGAVGRMVDFS